jgi:Flp pilus assembly protein TadD
MQGMMLSMKRSMGARRLRWRGVLLVMMWGVVVGGCASKAVPLAGLPLDHPKAAELNLKGIERYQDGNWVEAFELFSAALELDSDFVEAHFNAALALHQMERHEEASEHFRRAGELDPQNQAIVNSPLYRNHLGLSSTLERHFKGGYRYPRR